MTSTGPFSPTSAPDRSRAGVPERPAPPGGPRYAPWAVMLGAGALGLVIAVAWAALLIAAGAPRPAPDRLGAVTHAAIALVIYALALAMFYRPTGVGVAALSSGALLFVLAQVAEVVTRLYALPEPLRAAVGSGVLDLLGVAAIAVGVVNWLVWGARTRRQQARVGRQLAALSAAARELTGVLDPAGVGQIVLRQAIRALRTEAGSFLLVSAETGELEFLVVEGPQATRLVGVRLPPGAGIAGWVKSQGRPVRVANAQADSRFYEGVDRLTGQTTRSVLAVPIRGRDEVLGVIELINRTRADQPRRTDIEFTEDDLLFMTLLAGEAAAALENVRLSQELGVQAERLRHAYAKLEEADRARQRLVSDVAHELRAPLAFIKTQIDFLLESGQGPLNDEQREGLGIVSRKTGGLVRLATDLAEQGRMEGRQLELKPVDLGQLAREAAAAAQQSAAQSGVTVSTVVAPGLPPVPADEARIAEVFDSLLSSALRSTPVGGSITMRVEDLGDFVQATVEQRGAGVPGEGRAPLLDRLVQADSEAEGGAASLDLAVCQSIVNAHGGTIGMASEAGRGSAFYFTLPKALRQ